jgi:hypothetical protein
MLNKVLKIRMGGQNQKVWKNLQQTPKWHLEEASKHLWQLMVVINPKMYLEGGGI